MRCIACNVKLTEEECCNKSPITGLYIDLCVVCILESGLTSELTIETHEEIEAALIDLIEEGE